MLKAQLSACKDRQCVYGQPWAVGDLLLYLNPIPQDNEIMWTGTLRLIKSYIPNMKVKLIKR